MYIRRTGSAGHGRFFGTAGQGVFSDEEEEGRLSKEDAKMAMQTAASMVCGDCGRCSLPSDCEKKTAITCITFSGHLSRTANTDEDMPRLFETCGRKDAYLRQLNRNLGRATMNLTWKNRFFGKQGCQVIVQFRSWH